MSGLQGWRSGYRRRGIRTRAGLSSGFRAAAVGHAARPGARPRLDRRAGGVDGCRLLCLLAFVLRGAGFLHLLPAVAGRSRGDRQSGRDRPARYRPVVVMVGPVDIGEASERADRAASGPVYSPAGDVDRVEAGPGSGGRGELRQFGLGIFHSARHAGLRASGKYLRRGLLGHPRGFEEPRGGHTRAGARSATRQILGNRRLDSWNLLSADGRLRSAETREHVYRDALLPAAAGADVAAPARAATQYHVPAAGLVWEFRAIRGVASGCTEP